MMNDIKNVMQAAGAGLGAEVVLQCAIMKIVSLLTLYNIVERGRHGAASVKGFYDYPYFSCGTPDFQLS
jgi:hypothetical protein